MKVPDPIRSRTYLGLSGCCCREGSVYIPEYDIFLVLQIFDTDKRAFPDSGVDVHIDFGGMKVLIEINVEHNDIPSKSVWVFYLPDHNSLLVACAVIWCIGCTCAKKAHVRTEQDSHLRMVNCEWS